MLEMSRGEIYSMTTKIGMNLIFGMLLASGLLATQHHVDAAAPKETFAVETFVAPTSAM
jgi:hypothetical protein